MVTVWNSATYLPLPRETLFDVLEDAHQLWCWFPKTLGFRLLASSDERIREGTVLDYELRLRNETARCRSRIVQWAPPGWFADETIEGPLAGMRQEHEFVDAQGQTVLEEEFRVEFPKEWESHDRLLPRIVQRYQESRRCALWINLVGQAPPRRSPGGLVGLWRCARTPRAAGRVTPAPAPAGIVGRWDGEWLPDFVLCLSCLFHHMEPWPDPVPAGYFCSDYRLEPWERRGYRRDLGDERFHAWPWFEVMHRHLGSCDLSGEQEEIVILAPYDLRRDLVLHCPVPAGGIVRATWMEPRRDRAGQPDTCGGWTPEDLESKGYIRKWGDAAVRNWPRFEVLFRYDGDRPMPECEYVIFSRRLASPARLVYPATKSGVWPAGSY